MSRGSGYRQPNNWASIKRDILADSPACYLGCGRQAVTVDHVLNVARGGTHDRHNLAPICGPCHEAKTQSEALAGRTTRKRKDETHPGRRP